MTYSRPGHAGSSFERVFASLRAAGQRGVKIRFLLDQKGVGLSDKDTIAQLKAIPNLELRIIDISKLTGNGILHAKYLEIDGRQAYVGSQNFDWRSFAHIHETGLRISNPAIVGQVKAIFEQDWRAQAQTSAGDKATVLNNKVVAADYRQPAFLLASPNAYNPAGVGDSLGRIGCHPYTDRATIWGSRSEESREAAGTGESAGGAEGGVAGEANAGRGG